MSQLYSSILAGALACGLISCSVEEQAQSESNQPVTQVRITRVKTGRGLFYDEFPATLIPRKQIALLPQVSGFVARVHVVDGANVSAGQLLYSLDPEYYHAVYEQAYAQWRSREASHEMAQKDAFRYRQLLAQQAIASQIIDKVEADLRVAESQLAQAKAVVDAARANLRHVQVRAPFDGVVGISNAKASSPVIAGQTVLNTISTDAEYSAEFFVDQSQIRRFDSLRSVPASESSALVLRFGDQIFPHTGTLSLIDRSVDATSGRIRIRAVFPDTERSLRAGMSATIRVSNQSPSNSIMIPLSSVTEQLGEHFVYVVAADSTVTQRTVFPIRKTGDSLAIKAGLRQGELIVTAGIENLREGARVTAQN